MPLFSLALSAGGKEALQNLLLSMILLFINQHYRKTNKGKQEKKNRKKTNKNKRKMRALALPPFSFLKEYKSLM